MDSGCGACALFRSRDADSPPLGMTDAVSRSATGPVACTPAAGTRRKGLLWILAIAVVHLAQALPLLTAVPRAIMDESWEACTGFALAYEGRLRNPVIHTRYGIDRAFVQPRVTQSLALAALYRIGGFSLATGRLASVLVGLVAAWGVFYLMRTWLSHDLAGLVALLLVVDSHFFLTARMVRPEIYLLCASVWMLALLAHGLARNSSVRCAAAGVIGAVGCYTHPNMAIVVFLALVLILGTLRFTRRAWIAITWFGLAGVLAAAPFFAYVAYAHARHDVHFIEQLGGFYTNLEGGGAVTPLVREARRWRGYFQPTHRGPWLLVVAASLVYAFIRRFTAQRWALVLIGGHAMLMFLLIKMPAHRYLVVLSPWFAMLIVLLAARLWNRAPVVGQGRGRSAGRVLGAGLLVVAAANQVAGNAYMAYAYREADYGRVCQRIAAQIPAGARVTGPLVLWTGLHDRPFLSEIDEPRLRVEAFAPTLRSRLMRFDPQYLVRTSDRCVSLGGLGPRRTEANRDTEHTWADDLAEALANRYLDIYIVQRGGVLVDRFTTRDFGTIEVYRARW